MTGDLLLAAGFAAMLVGYALGTIPTAHLVARRHGIDPTTVGSGNPGATNVLRTVGRTAGIVTLASDLAKGAAAAGLGWAVDGRGLAVLCGVAAVIGHVAPVTRGFRGGKGVAAGIGMTAVTFPLAAAAGVVWFGAGRVVVKRTSAFSEAGIVAMPAVAAAAGATRGELVALVVCSLVVTSRLWAGRSHVEAAAGADVAA